MILKFIFTEPCRAACVLMCWCAQFYSLATNTHIGRHATCRLLMPLELLRRNNHEQLIHSCPNPEIIFYKAGCFLWVSALLHLLNMKGMKILFCTNPRHSSKKHFSAFGLPRLKNIFLLYFALLYKSFCLIPLTDLILAFCCGLFGSILRYFSPLIYLPWNNKKIALSETVFINDSLKFDLIDLSIAPYYINRLFEIHRSRINGHWSTQNVGRDVRLWRRGRRRCQVKQQRQRIAWISARVLPIEPLGRGGRRRLDAVGYGANRPQVT